MAWALTDWEGGGDVWGKGDIYDDRDDGSNAGGAESY